MKRNEEVLEEGDFIFDRNQEQFGIVQSISSDRHQDIIKYTTSLEKYPREYAYVPVEDVEYAGPVLKHLLERVQKLEEKQNVN